MPCSTTDDRVRWVSGALQENSQFDSVLVIGTVKSVVFDEGQPWVSVMFNDLWSLSRGKFARESRSVLAYACPQWPTSRNFNTTANVVARFAAGTKLMMFATPRLDSQTGNILYVSPCNGEITSACLVAGNPQCASGLVRQQLLAAASANADLARALDVDAAITCAKPCMNAGQCKLGVCACLANFTGETCEKVRLPPPAVTVTATRIVPGAGSNNSDVWVSGTTRKIQIPIQSVDRTTPTGFARVMLLNRSPASWCSQQLPNASLDGLPAWYFADMGPQVDLTTNPRYIATELLAVVDLSKLKWVTGSKARSTIVVEHTLTLAESCKDAGSDYRIAVMLSSSRADDAALAGPFTGGQFAIAEGGCIGDGVVGICRSRVGAADVCFAASPYGPPTLAAKTVTSGQCIGADTVCCIPDRTNVVAPPISPYTFFALNMPKSQPTTDGLPSTSSYAWGETVKLTWTTNRVRPQPSPYAQEVFPDGFCAMDQGLDTASSSFELLLVRGSHGNDVTNASNPIMSYGKVQLSLGKFDAELRLPQNLQNPYLLQFFVKFSDTCKYTSAPFGVAESPCFSTATKTLVGSCRAACSALSQDNIVIGTCTGLTHASKCCGRIRSSSDSFRFEDEEDEPAEENQNSASSMTLAMVTTVVMAIISVF